MPAFSLNLWELCVLDPPGREWGLAVLGTIHAPSRLLLKVPGVLKFIRFQRIQKKRQIKKYPLLCFLSRLDKHSPKTKKLDGVIFIVLVIRCWRRFGSLLKYFFHPSFQAKGLLWWSPASLCRASRPTTLSPELVASLLEGSWLESGLRWISHSNSIWIIWLGFYSINL